MKKQLDPSGLWKMLRDPQATASVEQADAVLSKFALDLHRYCRRERRPDERFRTLIFVRSFVIAPCEWAQGQEKQNGLHTYLSDIAARFIDGELELVRLEMQFPKSFIYKDKDRSPLAGWKGKLSELLELHTPVQLAGKISRADGESMSYADLIAFLRDAYGVDVSQPYGRKSGLLNRAKGGAPFLEAMIKIYLDEADAKHK